MPRKFIVGIYREMKVLVVRKFEVIAGIRICLDEQYVLNSEDAVIVQNHIVFKLYLNSITNNLYNHG
jgi:hypothetical protein